MALSGLHMNFGSSSYITERDKRIKRAESISLTPYYDRLAKSIAIGYGLDLLVNDNAAINRYLSAAYNLTGSGPQALSPEDVALLNDARARRKAGTANSAYLEGVVNQLSIVLPSAPFATNLYNAVVADFESQLDNALGYCMADSWERVALISLAYNGGVGMIGPKLRSAIANDNRAEAWYEIRYGSNGGETRGSELASRRYKEAALFNLYDAVFNEEGAKEVMRMYMIHKTDIERYERSYSPPSSITTQIFAAKNWLIATYSEGRYIRGEVIVGKGLDSYAYKDGDPNEIMTGTVETDLIFGEAGNDDIFAYNGDDIIYGGKGDDRIYGGYGDDILNGGSGQNILNGGTESDTYKIENKDKGENIIQDIDGKGSVMVDGAVLSGGTNANTVSSIYYTDGVNIYEWDGHNGSDLIINGTTRVENFYNTKLGINLIDKKGGNNDKPPNDSGGSKYPPGGGGADGDVDDTDDAFDGAGDMYDDGEDIPVPTPESPIILDLDGDGVETTNVKAGAYFDHDGNGFSEQTGWAGQDDGMLVMDRDGNGIVVSFQLSIK